MPPFPVLLRSAKFWTALAFLLGVAPIWLSSTEMWDGIIGRYALESNNWVIIKNWLLDSNWYVTYFIFYVADSIHRLIEVPHWILFKFWTTSMIFGVGFEVCKLAKAVFNIDKRVALWLPALIFSSPIWYVYFSYTAMIGHLTCVWLSLVGYRFLYSEKRSVYLAGIIAIVLSFQLASNCAFLIALEFSNWLINRNRCVWNLRRSFLILGLAVLVFFLTRIVWPPIGTYAEYNKLLNPFEVGSWLVYLQRTFYWSTWLMLLLPLGLVLFGFKQRIQLENKTNSSQTSHVITMWICFALLTVSATAPYVAVGLASPFFVVNLPSATSVSAVLAGNSTIISVWYGGWGARHAMLLMVVFALFIGWVIQNIKQDIVLEKKSFILTKKNVIAIIVVFNLVFLLPGHFAKLRRIAQERTIVELLKRTPEIPHGQVDFILDAKNDYLVSSYEANYLLYEAYKATNWLAFMLPDQPVVKASVEKSRESIFEHASSFPAVTAGQHVMTNYDWQNRCKTVVRLALPMLGFKDILWRAEHAPLKLPAASLQAVSSDCIGARAFWNVGSNPKTP